MRRLFASLLVLAVVGCSPQCPAPSSTITVGGADYCGTPCSTCAGCEAGFTCRFRSGSDGTCVDDEFLLDHGVGPSCVDPCATGEIRYDDMGTSSCVRICNVDGECPHCCFEPSDLEIFICAPRAELCM